ncbi:MAG TPA: hypothetical protein DCY13_21935 [Verrucomicrobiales bacterium]|nr:hypothetical protein [Verrucomicrobiales bacterium]
MSERDENGFRFERKYHVQDMPFEAIELLVRRNPALFRDAYPKRIVNNIYFDTPGLRSLLENMDGIADRTKARIRWYGPMLGEHAKPVLEFKLKRGMVGAKNSFRLQPLVVAKGMGAADVFRCLEESSLPESVLGPLRSYEPVLLNRYHRKYFISADRLYRITLDWQLEFFRFMKHNNAFASGRLDRDSTVVELKYSGAIDRIDERVAGYFPFRVTRMSKFVTGLHSIGAV